MTQLDARYRKSPSIVSREIAGETILVPIRQNVGDLESLYLLNETAMFAWQLFDGTHTLGDISQQISQEFEVDDEQAVEDLVELVNHLEKVGALLRT